VGGKGKAKKRTRYCAAGCDCH